MSEATTPVSDTASASKAAAGKPDAAQRQRDLVDQLLARPAATRSGVARLASGDLAYETHVGFLPVLPTAIDGPSGEPEAAIMATAYLLKGAAPAQRPVCFAFNGGPGSASVWLHLGALGPQRVVVPDDGGMPLPPYTVQDNPHSWFEHFDLVFIDPPHTGWSLTAGEAARKKMLSVDGDIDALAEVVRLWLTRHQRWGSAVYLAGESYGTTRGAGLASKLQDLGVSLSGLILVSCAMDLQSLVFAPGNDLPYALFLPAFAAVAQFHGLLGGSLGASAQGAREAAEAFASTDYLAALHAGARLGTAQRTRVARRLAELTGLPRALVEEKNLRISDQTFFFDALRSQGRIVGRLDARATGPMAASRTREWEFDPGMEAVVAPYTMAAMHHFSSALGLGLDQPYQVLNREVGKAWNWNRAGKTGEGFTSTSPDLARALRRHPHLQLLVASGRYDLGTPYSASDWSLAQLDLPADVAARVQHRYYDAGHMMYTRQADLVRLKNDLADWLKQHQAR